MPSRKNSMRGFGLIGFPLSHSFSKQYFTDKFRREHIANCYYETFPIEEINLLPDLLSRQNDLVGLNVTIPYKEQIIPYLDEIENDARAIGAVNTVKIIRFRNTARLIGYNTDSYGFHKSISPSLKPYHKKALILGTGGASKAVAYVLKKLSIDLMFVSRTPRHKGQISYKDITDAIISDYRIIVNTSPLGMYPDTGSFPDIPYRLLTPEHILFDLIYNPLETHFLRKGKAQGCIVVNGLDMLYYQAERAWEIWNKSE